MRQDMTTPVYDSVAFLASDTFAVFNAAGDSFVSAFAPGARLRADCGPDGVLLGTVASSSHDAETGRTVVATVMDGGAALTANLAEVLHGNDVPESLCAHAALHAPGGRDALPAASTGASGLVALANAAETRAGAEAAKAVTPAGLAAAAKGLITSNTTIYVATTGSDASGDGSSAAPYASIAKALSSIANKLIASGVTVTIQVANGTYNTTLPIKLSHPDGDKIQIIGNISTETTVAISSIDTTAKTITVTGNYAFNTAEAKNIQIGDIIGLAGSSTNGLNGAYLVSNVTYDGANTTIECSTEAFASSLVGGGSLVIKPCNRCCLEVSGSISCFSCSSNLSLINGFRIKHVSGSSTVGIYASMCTVSVGSNIIIDRLAAGLSAYRGGRIFGTAGFILHGCATGISINYVSSVTTNGAGTTIINGSSTGCFCSQGSFGYLYNTTTVFKSNTINCSPAVNVVGNYNSFIGS